MVVHLNDFSRITSEMQVGRAFEVPVREISVDYEIFMKFLLQPKYSKYVSDIRKVDDFILITCKGARGENNSRLPLEFQKNIDELIMEIPYGFKIKIIDEYGHKVFGYDK